MEALWLDRETYLGWLVRDVREYYLERYLADFMEVRLDIPVKEVVHFLPSGYWITYSKGEDYFQLENGVQIPHRNPGTSFRYLERSNKYVVTIFGSFIFLYSTESGTLLRRLTPPHLVNDSSVSASLIQFTTLEIDQLTDDYLIVVYVKYGISSRYEESLQQIRQRHRIDLATYQVANEEPIARPLCPFVYQATMERIFPILTTKEANYSLPRGYVASLVPISEDPPSYSLHLYGPRGARLVILTSPHLNSTIQCGLTPDNRFFFYQPGQSSLWYTNH